jgi:hypothetical protein
VTAYPNLKFVIINAEKLNSKNLEVLLMYLTDQQVVSMGIQLHCIQRGDSLIHTSPWIVGKSWSLELLESSLSCWNSEIEKHSSVFVVASNKCGSGKTYFIRTKIKEIETSVESATLIIHEKSSVSTLVQALQLKLPAIRQCCALHISFMYLPIGGSNDQWLLEMNHFMFSLIILQYVYDPLLKNSFFLAKKVWLYVEIPALSEDPHVWLKKNIPVIASCAEFPDIQMPFHIDHKAQRVCTYLRAFDTGTIDRRYESASNKRIILVLDTSGSMNGSKFVTAKNNAVSIFDSHIVEGDVSEYNATLNEKLCPSDTFPFSRSLDLFSLMTVFTLLSQFKK